MFIDVLTNSGRRPHACSLEPPHPARPPNAVKRSRRKYHSGVITVLQSKYIDSLRKPTSYKELVSENPEIRFDEFSSMIRVAYRMKTEDFLYDMMGQRLARDVAL